MQDELRQLHRRLGITIVYVTHDQEEAMRLSQRIAIFSHGKIVGLGSGFDLYQTPQIRFVYLGSRFMLHASFPHSVALMQLRFASFAVASLREDFHL